VVVVRGISDRADGTKEATDHEQWQPRAVTNAADFAAALAESLAAEDRYDDRPTATRKSRDETMQVKNQNIAKGNARVDVQAGVVYGGVRNSRDQKPHVDLAQALAALRTNLHQARSAGHLDEDTCDAAEAELTVAVQALQTNTPQRLVLALKKVRGLTGDVADLAAEVTAIIAFAQDGS
jgi:adenosylhomocysteine nucleosidase